ncbi:MAG: hypothetical protein NZ922_04740 [Candidatus Methanomethyliaceae archaeon]|nr:hypothetical protein [Candidatus Methanomethyliaceae archaeon]MDW7971404.1 hypothetical protein [Nitrososphaerota archaeon]
MKKVDFIPIMALISTILLIAFTILNQISWERHEYYYELRRSIGIPSIAIGTNYEGTRNPLLDIFVRSLYDVPGGYDYVVASSFIDTPLKLREFFERIPEFNISIRKG